MKPIFLGGVSALALSLCTSSAWGLTAQEAWASWQSMATAYGQTLAGENENSSGGTLTVKGVTLTAENEDVSTSITMDQLVFSEQSDGTVSIAMPDSYPIAVEVAPTQDDEFETFRVTLSVTQPGTEVVAQEGDEGILTKASSPELLIEVSEMTVDDEVIDINLDFAATNMDWQYEFIEAETASLISQLNADTFAVDLSVTDTEESGSLNMAVSAADIQTQSMGSLVSMFSTMDMSTMLADGFATEGGGSVGATTFEMDFNDPEMQFAMAGAMAGAKVDGSMNSEMLAYDVTYEDVTFAASGSEIPFPQVTAAIGQSQTFLSMPVAPSEEAAPFALTLALRDLTMGEEIWSLFDPAGALPRDPATLVMDLTGMGRWLIDIFDEDMMMVAAEPGEVEQITIRELELSAVGAQLTGSGAFTLDPDAPMAPGEMPPLDGTLNLRLLGGNGLLDRLVQMGLLPQEQAMMGRMMAGMLAKPGDQADELVSEITIRPDGTILANGAPLPF